MRLNAYMSGFLMKFFVQTLGSIGCCEFGLIDGNGSFTTQPVFYEKGYIFIFIVK
jgi:hypothetical protein